MANELLEGLEVACILAEDNPCGMKAIVMDSIGKALKALISRDYARGLSQDRVARYYGVTTRTLQRWANLYDDFPRPRYDGHKKPSYDAMEVATWKKNHKSAFCSCKEFAE